MRKTSPKWAVVEDSVRGASHVRDGRPNQDAIRYFLDSDEKSAILAVSDGHGSPRSFRSQFGAQCAVTIAVELSDKFLRGMKGRPHSAVREAAERHLSAEIVKVWSESVSKNQKQAPFTEEELAQLELELGSTAKTAAVADDVNLTAYGATLILVVASVEYVFYLQLGDGDVLTVFDRDEVPSRPLPPDPALIGNETTSLCMPGAQKLFRFRFQPNHDDSPALILASTDGYSNAFASDADFEKAGMDYLELFRAHGPEHIRQNLSEWLSTASSDGSGDDVSLGLIFRRDHSKPKSGIQFWPSLF